MKMDSVLRPRDIQARIRSGESPEAVAAAAQTSVDKIMGFATPVLAERAYVAQQAQKASVRRRAAEGPGGQLGDAVTQRLEEAGSDPESVDWDAWRREDGRWTLVAEFTTAGAERRAQFVYDMAGRYVVSDDDDARWLIGERTATPAPEPEPEAGAAAGSSATDELEDAGSAPTLSTAPAPRPEARAPRRLASVQEEQLPMGDDAIEVVTGRRPNADWISTQASDRPALAEPADALFEAPAPTPDPTPELAPEPAPEPLPEPAQPELDLEEPEGADEEPAKAPSKKPAKQSRAKGRASVPSWDEIMFGSNQGD
jgi:hypothetical protein